MRIDAAKTIQGWMNEAELRTLATLASKARRVLEMGCWKGRSTRAILDNLPPEGGLTCIDTFMGSEGEPLVEMAAKEDIFSIFHENTRGFGVRVLRCPTREALEMLVREEPFDLIFIDADHRYEEVLADIRGALKILSPRGILAGHDYCPSWPGVVRAVDEALGKNRVVFTPGTSIWYAVPSV